MEGDAIEQIDIDIEVEETSQASASTVEGVNQTNAATSHVVRKFILGLGKIPGYPVISGSGYDITWPVTRIPM